ncbi:MAG TPA: saccharopine dehydrogenase C-terminal domain-containing protein [Bacteroidales bacterium]|nr:saccharopine dehydrogenase C-terminal domain-containing protein [Bacteroidales bacterium]
MDILVLGAGLVGGPLAIDLAKDDRFSVTAVDLSKDALQKLVNYPVKTVPMDLRFPEEVTRLAGRYDMVVNAVPGSLGFQTLKALIWAGKDIVDISFFPEDPMELDEIARRKNVTVVTDCGVAPGMCNVLIGHADSLLNETEKVVYYVGGLPEIREWPWEYKAVFSPSDVIEEYTRPARLVENGKIVEKPALSDLELIDFPGVGTLEAFNTDGLRSLLKTIQAPDMKEKTLRYPGHAEKIKILKETGFFSQEEIGFNGCSISAVDFTAKVLFPKWKLKENETDFTLMKVIVEGKKDEERLRLTYDLFDKYDASTGVHSMARTTGYTATVTLRMIIDGLFREKGIIVPEMIGKNPDCVKYLLNGLKERGVVYRESVTTLSADQKSL